LFSIRLIIHTLFFILVGSVQFTIVSYGQQLPPPQPQGNPVETVSGLDKRIEGPVEARGIQLSEILGILQAESGLQMVLDKGVDPQVTFNLQNPTVREVLNNVLPANGLDFFESESGVVRIGNEPEIAILKMPAMELATRTFTPRHVDIEQLQGALDGMRSPNGRIIIDPDTRKIIVRDIPEVLEEMAQLIYQLDMETETRVIPIKYANAQEIADQLAGVINTAQGELFIDYRNNLIIITDTPDRLDMAQAIIEQLDVELEFRVIPLAFALPEDVIPIIEGLLTENGYVDFDPRTSRLFIQDIPSIVDQIIKLIKQLDIATQQVYIEADIVQINNDKSLTFGTSAAFGSDIGAGGVPSSPSTGSATGADFFSFNPFLTTSGDGLTLMDVRQGSYRFQINAMVENRDAEVIASPRLLIQDGEMGFFNLGSQEPFSTRQYGGYYGGGYGGQDIYTQSFRNVGTQIELEVYASEAGYVELYISMQDTRSRRVQLSNIGEALAIDGSFINTAVTVKSGRTVVLGGIITRNSSKSQSGVPVLSSIPVLGALFRNKSSSSTKQKLLVFITPTIVNIDDPYSFAQVDNIQRVQDLQESGATGFVETNLDDRYLKWDDERKNEQAAIEDALGQMGRSQRSSENAKSLNEKSGKGFQSVGEDSHPPTEKSKSQNSSSNGNHRTSTDRISPNKKI
jgi:type II secretory pathway component GspD/PulD (secretin)